MILISGFRSSNTCEYDPILIVLLILVIHSNGFNSHKIVLSSVVLPAQFSQIIPILSLL
jgi:hypothetical protein